MEISIRHHSIEACTSLYTVQRLFHPLPKSREETKLRCKIIAFLFRVLRWLRVEFAKHCIISVSRIGSFPCGRFGCVLCNLPSPHVNFTFRCWVLVCFSILSMIYQPQGGSVQGTWLA